MFRARSLIVAALLAGLALAVGLSAQAPPLTPRARGYADFALGKWADLKAQQPATPGAADDHAAVYAQVLADYRAALAAHPDSIYLTGQVADLLARMGRGDEAVALAQKTVAAAPGSIPAQEMLSGIYLDELENAAPSANNADQSALLTQAVTAYQRLIQLDPNNAGDHVTLGRLFNAQHQLAAAEAQFRAALALSPGDQSAVASLVEALVKQNKLPDAAKVVAGLPPAAQNPEAVAILGEAYYSRSLYPQAAAAFRQAVQQAPGDKALESALAQSLMQAGNYPEALTAFQNLLKQSPNDGRTALRVAQAQMQMGQLAAAGESLQRARALLPAGNLEVGYAQALLDQSQGNDAAAIAGLQALVARPTPPRTRSIFLDQLARLEMDQGQDDAAAGHLRQLQALGGAYAARAQALQLELYTRQRDFAKALEVVRAQLAAAPDSRSLRLSYAALLSDSGDTAAALAALRPLTPNGAGSWDVAIAQSRIQAAARQWKPALASARRARQLAAGPTQTAAAVAQLADVQSRQHKWKDAEKSLRSALALAPGRPATLSALGYVLAQRNQHLPEALTDAQRAVAAEATNAGFLDHLGWIYLKLNQVPLALGTLQKAARLQPNDPVILDHLAQAQIRAGHLPQAAQDWRTALAQLKLTPWAGDGADQATQIQQQLDRLQRRLNAAQP